MMTDLDKIQAQYPNSWAEYVGQIDAKYALRIAAQASKLLGEQLPHILITSPYPGIGKTALALLTIRAADRPVHWASGQMSIEAAMEMFSNAEDGDICFYDEFHKVMDGGAKNAEWMLNYLIDGVLFTPWGIEEVPKVTFVGATTEKGKILETIVDRFKLIELDPYTNDEAAAIAVSMSTKVFAPAKMTPINQAVALAIAEAASRQPRRMRQLLMSVRDLVVCEELEESPTGDYDLAKPLAFAGLTPDGLTKEARNYLLLLKKNGGKAGKEVLTARLGLAGTGLVRVERLLMDKSLIVQTTSGRQLTIPGSARVTRLLRENA